jgi:4-amino-4-deoxy-L-arabinose transferase-like glycosyltransferase
MTVLLTTVTAVVALRSPVASYDGLLYHLPRVMHWRDNVSLAFYPSHVLPQLHHPPLAEVMMLHTVLLSGGDSFTNMVSWWAYAGCIVGVSVIAKHLGVGGLGQALAGLLVATIPIALLQSSGPKNDIGLAFWVVCLCWLVVRGFDRLSLLTAIGMGVSLGLALATKGSAAVFLAPILAVFFTVQLARQKTRMAPVLTGYVVIGLVGLAVAAPHALRNWNLYGSVLGPPYDGPTEAFAYTSTAFDPPHLASATIKHVATQLGTPWESINQLVDGAVRGWHQWAGLSVDDPTITWGNRTFFVVRMRALQEDSAPNPLTIVLIGAGLVLAIARWRQLPPAGRSLIVGLVLAFMLYSALLKWQPSTNRFQLPLMVLWCPVIALFVVRLSRRAVLPLAALATIGVMPAVLDSRWRPLTGEMSIFMGDRAALAQGLEANRKEALEQAAAVINRTGCARVGLEMGWDQVEYPWRRMLLPAARVEHINVRNVSARLPYPAGEPVAPCAAISLRAGAVERMVIDGIRLEAVAADELSTVYLPEGQAPPVKLRFSAEYFPSVPDSWQPDSTQRYPVTLVNGGTETWSTIPGFVLIASFGREEDELNEAWETQRRMKLPADVAPGDSITVDMELQAPSRPGRYIVRHVLERDGSPTFGQLHRSEVTVEAPGRRRR